MVSTKKTIDSEFPAGHRMNTPHLIPFAGPSPSVREIETADGAVLLDIQQGLCFSVNPVGARIWHLVKQQQSLDQIVDTLAVEFNVPKGQIRDDVVEFASVLNQKGLLLSEASGSTKRSAGLRNLMRLFKSICICC